MSWVSFEEEARARADEIVRAARAEADRVREEARREGFDRGRDEGRAQAAREERERVAAEAAALRAILEEAARALLARRDEFLAAAERDLVRLAVAIAGKIVRAEVQSGRKVAPAAVRRAVELAGRRRELRVLLHPEDLALVDADLPALRRDFPQGGPVTLEASDRVSRGGCLVLTAEGAVDAEVETQLREIERGLLE
jgi:flagellar assembly protein FliH